MFNSTVLDVAVGLSLVYLLFSLLCSSARELIARVLSERERGLIDGVHRALGAAPPGSAKRPAPPTDGATDSAQALVGRVLDHPLIAGMATKTGKAPSYLSARTFALALVDVLSPRGSTSSTIEGMRDSVMTISDRRVRDALLPLITAVGSDLSSAQRSIERHFDEAMDRASGWYKRRTQVWILVAAVVAVGAGNVDSLAIASHLYRDPAIRAHAVASAGAMAHAPPPVNWDAYETSSNTLKTLQLPIGWTKSSVELTPLGILFKGIGLLVTVLAILLGAPFWFDLLSRLGNLRTSGPRPAPSAAPPDETPPPAGGSKAPPT